MSEAFKILVELTKNNMSNIRPYGKRVLVRKERVDLGGLRGTPAIEEDGMKNTGTITAVGQIGLFARLAGIKVGAKIRFRKYFVCDDGSDSSAVFVDIENITGIEE